MMRLSFFCDDLDQDRVRMYSEEYNFHIDRHPV